MSIRSSQEFFGELREWSERKLKILEGYLDPFVKVLGSSSTIEHVFYVDAFAGAGLYRDGEMGSALRAAELAIRYQAEGKQYRLKCINVEADKDNFENLQSNTVEYDDLVLNLFGTFSENIDRILRETAGSPALFFLDPFGVKGINWDLLQRVIHRGDITDLWVRFDQTAVLRLAGRYGNTGLGAEKSFSILCDTYGVYDPDLLHKQLASSIPADKKQKAVNLYKEILAKEFRQVRQKGFVAAYPIRSITEQDKYSLIFATGHPRGAIIASELICSTEETYKREVEEYKANRPRQLSLFSRDPSEEEIFQSKILQLADSMESVCKGKNLTRSEIYERILPEWFGKIRATHVTKALKVLQEDGRIKHSNGAPSNRKTVFEFRE